MFAVKKGIKNVKKAVMNYSEVELKVRNATSNEPWGASPDLMQEIALATFDPSACKRVTDVLFKRLGDRKNWRHVYKGLALLEYLVKAGSSQFLQDVADRMSDIDAATAIQFADESETDHSVVRTRAREVATLLRNKEAVEHERQPFAAFREAAMQEAAEELATETEGRRLRKSSVNMSMPVLDSGNDEMAQSLYSPLDQEPSVDASPPRQSASYVRPSFMSAMDTARGTRLLEAGWKAVHRIVAPSSDTPGDDGALLCALLSVMASGSWDYAHLKETMVPEGVNLVQERRSIFYYLYNACTHCVQLRAPIAEQAKAAFPDKPANSALLSYVSAQYASHQNLTVSEVGAGAYRDAYILVLLSEKENGTLAVTQMFTPINATSVFYVLHHDGAFDLLEPNTVPEMGKPETFQSAPEGLQHTLQAMYAHEIGLVLMDERPMVTEQLPF